MLRRGAGSVVVINRTREKADVLAQVFGPKVSSAPWDNISGHLASANIVINTTSAGIADAKPLTLPFEKARPATIIADINYVPLVTPLLHDAKAHCLRVVPGLGMLLHQAVTGFELWFGVRPEVTPELYDLIAANVAGTVPK
jgi:shikimate dehydrogenase